MLSKSIVNENFCANFLFAFLGCLLILRKKRLQLLCLSYENTPFFKNGCFKGVLLTDNGASLNFTMFIKSVKYYLINEGRFKEVPLNKRIFKLFGEHGKTVEVYAKANELSPSKEGNIIALFKYFDSL